MVSEWRETTIGEFAPFSYGKGLPEHERESHGKVPVFGSNGFVGYHDSALTKGPTVIIGRKGTVGAVHYSPASCWPIDTTFWISETDEGILRFKYYLLKSLGLDRMNSDSAVPGLNREAAHGRRILVPPLPEQRAIAHILGTLDDKIELNRQMNQTLEAMAQALFKSWFVDFEPFRHQGMQDSPLGKIPVGWRIVSLGDVATIHDSQRIPLSSRERAQRKGIFPYYGAASIMDYIDNYLFDGIYVLIAEDGSVIDEHDNPVVQYVWGKFWVNNHAHVLQGSNGVSTEHLLLFLRQLNIHPYVTGAVQPKLNQENMRRIPFILPTYEICNSFREKVMPLYSAFRANVDQSNSLATMRDTLLPKLLSGEIRVKDAEKFVEKAI